MIVSALQFISSFGSTENTASSYNNDLNTNQDIINSLAQSSLARVKTIPIPRTVAYANFSSIKQPEPSLLTTIVQFVYDKIFEPSDKSNQTSSTHPTSPTRSVSPGPADYFFLDLDTNSRRGLESPTPHSTGSPPLKLENIPGITLSLLP